MEQTEKPIYKRAFACFCAFLICCLVVFCGFAIPKVHAESIADQWEDYIDQTFGEGSSFVMEEVLDEVSSASGIVPHAAYLGIGFGLNVMEVDEPKFINSRYFGVLQGVYYGGSDQYTYCCSSLPDTSWNGDFINGIICAESKDFRIKAVTNPNGNITTSGLGFYSESGINCFGIYLQGSGTLVDISNDKQNNTGIFTTGLSMGSSSYNRYIEYGSNIPDLSGQSDFSPYIGTFVHARTIAGGFGASTKVVPHDMGIPDATIDLSDPSDYIVNVVNEWFIENDPDYENYIFIPQETPSETTSPSGCGCHVDVYVEPTIIVNVEPTIIVDNNIQFPSDWNTEYTAPSIPSHETIPFPTQDSSNTEPFTMPTMDVDEYKETYGNAIEFWFYLASQLIEKLGLELLTGFAFVLSVVGFVLWRLGSSGGGKND